MKVPAKVVLIVEGLHVPGIPLLEMPGRIGGIEFWHRGPIVEKLGEILAVTRISIVVVRAHSPPLLPLKIFRVALFVVALFFPPSDVVAVAVIGPGTSLVATLMVLTRLVMASMSAWVTG